jgi:hypothetical protein
VVQCSAGRRVLLQPVRRSRLDGWMVDGWMEVRCDCDGREINFGGGKMHRVDAATTYVATYQRRNITAIVREREKVRCDHEVKSSRGDCIMG